MRDLEEVREYDLSRGIFDIYVDDIAFPSTQYVAMRENDIVRFSEIDPYSVSDKLVFKFIDEATEFMKSVLDDVFEGQEYSVKVKSFEGYVKKLLEAFRLNPRVVDRIKKEKFKQNDMVECFLLRDVIARFNKFENEAVQNKMGDKEHYEKKQKYQIEYTILCDILEQKKAKPVYKNNISVKPIN